jgi:hypothetical protein
MNDMTGYDPGQFAPPPSPKVNAGQGTMVEQARAIAEVRAAVMIAMERPRDRQAAIAEMREVCGIQALAERAFFRVPRGGQQVNGESIHLARELARCWGNIDYGVKELGRDDARGQSELLAFAWDMQTNARSEITFIVPHKRGSKAITGTQEVYENNASFAGRRLREAIFSVLPVWFKEEAATICHQTLQKGGGKPIDQRRADCLVAFENIGVSRAQLERKQGRKVEDLTATDLAQLGVILKSIARGEVARDEEFPRDQIAAPANADGFEAASAGAAPRQAEPVAAAPPAAPAASSPPEDDGWPGPKNDEPRGRSRKQEA